MTNGFVINTAISQLLLEKDRDAVIIEPTAAIYEAVWLMGAKNTGLLFVHNSQKIPERIFLNSDALQWALFAGKHTETARVQKFTNRNIAYAPSEQTEDECMTLMTFLLSNIGRGQNVIGDISTGDFVKHMSATRDLLIRDFQNHIEGML